MWTFKGIMCKEAVYLWPLVLYSMTAATDYPLGAIFDRHSSDIKYAFEQQINFINNNQRGNVRIIPKIEELDATDSFAVSNAICSLLKKGVYGIIGISNTSALATIQSYSNTFKVPFIALNMAQNSSNHGPFQIFMKPMYINGLLDVIVKYGWTKLLYLYDTDEGLMRLQQLFQSVNTREHTIDINVKRITDHVNGYEVLRDIHLKNYKQDIRVFLDIPTEKANDIILTLKNDTDIKNHKFHFLLGEMRIEEMALKNFKNGGINITGFQLLNYTNLLKQNMKESSQINWRQTDWRNVKDLAKIPLDPALIIDAVDLFYRALKQFSNSNFGFREPILQNVKCTDNSYSSPYNGSYMMEKLKGRQTDFNGLTGNIRFDENGYRKNFLLHLYSITVTMGIAQVGLWSRESGLTTQEPYRRRDTDVKNRTRIITTILEDPYVMYKDEATAALAPSCGNEHFIGYCVQLAKSVFEIVNQLEKIKYNYTICIVPDRKYGERYDENGTWNGMVGELVRQEAPYVMYKTEALKARGDRCGKDNFHGFCVDLAERVAEIVKYDYEICLVKDDKYGEKLENETWNGMIGELTQDEVDLAIAPLTISSQRERVVDFTKPFMSLGISIMIKKTQLKKTSVFSFMDPLSYEIWMCIVFAYIGVSVVLFLVSRFSPTEWHVDEGTKITNDFTISNSLWYSLGAFMQQGCDISPRSVSGRIVGSVWWFFTLIIISSYTANLAAFLTVERMLTPIESAEDLAKQTEIQYGTVDSGSTKDFFKFSKFMVHERMWAYMQSANPSVFVANNDEGINRVRQGNYALLIESQKNLYTNLRFPCDTMKVGPNLDSKGYGIATPIGSDLRDKLTLAVLKLRESGDLEEMQKEWWQKRSECHDEPKQDGGQTELNLDNVAGIFYILVSGLVLSVLVACMEFLYKSKLDSNRTKKSFGSVLRTKARLSFRGSLDRDTAPVENTNFRNSMSTYTYTGPSQVGIPEGYQDNLHTQV